MYISLPMMRLVIAVPVIMQFTGRQRTAYNDHCVAHEMVGVAGDEMTEQALRC